MLILVSKLCYKNWRKFNKYFENKMRNQINELWLQIKNDKEVVLMIISIFSVIAEWITAFSTAFNAREESKNNTIKTNNYINKLFTVLKLYYDKYNEQLDILKEIFRKENEYEQLGNILKIKDLEMIAYIESMMNSCQNCIEEFPCEIEVSLNDREYDKLFKFYSYLKNFFMITNQIKNSAQRNNDEECKMTVIEYKELILKDIPYSLRVNCGGVDSNFIEFLDKFDTEIKGIWSELKTTLFKDCNNESDKHVRI